MEKSTSTLTQVEIRSANDHLTVFVGGAGKTIRFKGTKGAAADIKNIAKSELTKMQEAARGEVSLLVLGKEPRLFHIDGRRTTVESALAGAWEVLQI